MTREPDNELRVIVATVKKDRTAFKVQIGEANGSVHDQWFNLSTQGEQVVCPNQGDDIIVGYNVSPGTTEYPNPTYWANSIRSANGADETPAEPMDTQPAPPHMPAQTPQGTYEKVRAAVAEPPAEKAPPQKELPQRSPDPSTRERSAEWNTAVMTAREVLVANQTWDDNHTPITGAEIAAMARDIYYGKDRSEGDKIPVHTAANYSMPREDSPPGTRGSPKAFDNVNCDFCGVDDSEEPLVVGLDSSKAHERCIGG